MSRTTAAYTELVDKENRLASDLALAQAQLFPLRKENSRLTRENHQLHLDNIRQQDESSSMFADQNINIRKLKDEISDLQLVVKMKHEEVRRIDAEKERIKDAYEELADPSMKNKGVKRMMKISSHLPAPAAAGANSTTSGAKPPVRILFCFSSFLFLFVMSPSLSRSITACLSAFSDTTWHESNHHSHPSINQSQYAHYLLPCRYLRPTSLPEVCPLPPRQRERSSTRCVASWTRQEKPKLVQTRKSPA
jgi:hypothetical protein